MMKRKYMKPIVPIFPMIYLTFAEKKAPLNFLSMLRTDGPRIIPPLKIIKNNRATYICSVAEKSILFQFKMLVKICMQCLAKHGNKYTQK
jgi:hypothetical protein